MRSSVTSKRFQANEQLYYPDVFTVDIKHNIISCTCELHEKSDVWFQTADYGFVTQHILVTWIGTLGCPRNKWDSSVSLFDHTMTEHTRLQ